MSVIVFGSINMDLIVRCAHIPLPGETLLGHGFLIAPGGKGANQAVAAARLGATTYMVGRVGNDAFGTQLLAHLSSDGVIISGVTVETGESTGVALITVESSGENTIVVAPGANAKVGERDVQMVLAALEMETARVLMLQLEIPLQPLIAAAVAARAHGVMVILDPAPVQELPPELYEAVDILTPNESEAAGLVGFPLSSSEAIKRAARILLDRGAQNIVIKLGRDGVYWACKMGGEFLPAPKVDVVDTVAAGDAFNGGLAAAINEGRSFRTAISWGLACGALAVTKAGAQPSLPRREAMLDMSAKMNAHIEA